MERARWGWVALVSLAGGGLGSFLLDLQSAEAVPGRAVTATYIGVTNTARLGSAGLPVMNADCAALFAGSRICRDVEVLQTFPMPVPGVDARVLATVVGVASSSDNQITPYGLVLSTAQGEGANCSGNQIGGDLGLFTKSPTSDSVQLTDDGNLQPIACGASLVTACCVP